jgi:hypothetical protein
MTTAVVLIKADILAVTIIKMGAKKKRGSDLIFARPEVIHTITPFSSMATAKIINARTAMVALLENPLIASSGVTNPNKVNETIIKKAILSTGKISRAKKIMVIAKTTNTRPMSNVIPRLLNYRSAFITPQ